MTPQMRAILLNNETIAVNQDASATAGDAEEREQRRAVWARPRQTAIEPSCSVLGGDKYIELHRNEQHMDAEQPLTIACTWQELGPPATATVRARPLGEENAGRVCARVFSAGAPTRRRFLRLLCCRGHGGNRSSARSFQAAATARRSLVRLIIRRYDL